MINQIISILAFFVVLFLFSGFEFAFDSKNILNSDPEKKKSGLRFNIIPNLIKIPNYFISIMFFGHLLNISIICFLLIDLLSPIISKINGPFIIDILAYTFVIAFIIFIIGVFLPRAIYKIWPETTMNIIALPLAIIYFACFPLVRLVYEFSWIISGLFLRKKNAEKPIIKNNASFYLEKTEAIQEPSNDLEAEIEHDVKLFQNALEFSKIKVRDCTIPRNEIEAIELSSSIEKLKERFIETGFSKILVYHETIDNIIGYAQSTDIFKSPRSVQSILKSLVIVPETMPANKLLNLFLKDHKSISLVVDEFGGTYGIATLEDIMEEIFGDIEDEHDFIEFREEKLSEREYIFSGRLEIDYLNEKYNLLIPESDEYATIAGFILHFNEEIPKENDKFRIDKFEFEILKLQNPKIKLVKLKLLK